MSPWPLLVVAIFLLLVLSLLLWIQCGDTARVTIQRDAALAEGRALVVKLADVDRAAAAERQRHKQAERDLTEGRDSYKSWYNQALKDNEKMRAERDDARHLLAEPMREILAAAKTLAEIAIVLQLRGKRRAAR